MQDVQSVVANPLDYIEGIVEAHEWPFERLSEEELTATAAGSWCRYQLRFLWREECAALHFVCAFDFRVPRNKHDNIYELLSLINQDAWFGHFDFWPNDGMLLHRYCMLLLNPDEVSRAHCEYLLENSFEECERVYPAIQFVLWAGKRPSEAIQSTMFETQGEA